MGRTHRNATNHSQLGQNRRTPLQTQPNGRRTNSLSRSLHCRTRSSQSNQPLLVGSRLEGRRPPQASGFPRRWAQHRSATNQNTTRSSSTTTPTRQRTSAVRGSTSHAGNDRMPSTRIHRPRRSMATRNTSRLRPAQHQTHTHTTPHPNGGTHMTTILIGAPSLLAVVILVATARRSMKQQKTIPIRQTSPKCGLSRLAEKTTREH